MVLGACKATHEEKADRVKGDALLGAEEDQASGDHQNDDHQWFALDEGGAKGDFV